MNTKERGETTEAIVLAELKKRGYNVAKPFGENTPYDLIVDDGKNLKKAQVKTAWEDNGKVKFNCKSTRSNFTESSKETYEGKIDSFIVYAPCLESLFEVPIEDANETRMSLRYCETNNGQSANINWVDDYRI